MKKPKIRLRSIKSISNCKAKRAFRSEIEAEKAAEIQMLQNMSLELQVYRCEWCGKWHLTRQQTDKY